MKLLSIAILISLLSAPNADADEEGKHLFILSGQSNMTHMKAAPFFNAVREEFGNGKVAVVKDDQSGQPISRWYKKWKSIKGEKPAPERTGDLYDRLMKKVKAVTSKNKIQTVTFVWMQGETDARRDGEVYKASLEGLMEQLCDDLGRKDLNFVLGRLSDHNKTQPKKWLHWDLIREIQVEMAESSPRGAWVDTDDLNDVTDKKGNRKDNVHYTKDGYKLLSQRFAEKAIALVKKCTDKPDNEAEEKPEEVEEEEEKE